MSFWSDLWQFIHPAPPAPMAPPMYTEYQLIGDQAAAFCMSAKDHVYAWADQVFVLSLDDWKAVFKDVCSNLPVYQAEKFKCDMFAFSVMARVNERYEINGCGVAIGQNAAGAEHGFNLFISCDDGIFNLHILEPQNGQIDPPGYVYDTVIFS
jgi:hypothetical protein